MSDPASVRLLRLDTMCSAEYQQLQCSIAACAVLWKCMFSAHRLRVLWNSDMYNLLVTYQTIDVQYI